MGEVKLMKGNEALAEAAIRAGCRGYFGYPITPQSEVLEYLAADERLIAAFAVATGCNPADVARAHAALGGEPWEREIP